MHLSRNLFLSLLLTTCTSLAQFVSIAEDFSPASAVTGSTPDAGSGNWTNISGTSGAIGISSGAAQLLTTSSEATQLNFATADRSTGTYYVGFSFTVSSTGTINTNDSIQSFFGYRTGTAGSGTYAGGFGVFRPSANAQTNSSLSSTSSSQVVAGIFTGSSLNASTGTLTSWATLLSRGTTYRAVMGFDLDNDTLKLWINPTSVSSTSITLTGVTANIRAIYLRSGNGSTGDIVLDDIAGSTSFTTAAAIPEPAAVGVWLGLGSLAFVSLRRQKNR